MWHLGSVNTMHLRMQTRSRLPVKGQSEYQSKEES